MRVLSLFDGISCARVALERAGLEVTHYYASEIDKHAIAVSQRNHPDIVQLGDVRTLHDPTPSIDLLIGGSPCIDLSIAKQNRRGLNGEHSSLFWEYVRVLKLVRPSFFILENVASMPKADRAIITETLGAEPILLDASLVSAQSRRRLFWTNLPNRTQPEDKGITLQAILQSDEEIDPRMMTASKKAFCLTSTYGKVGTTENEYERNAKAKKRTLIKLGYLGDDAQANRVYSPEGKSATLNANGGGMGAKTGLYWIPPPYPIHVPEGASTAPIRIGIEMRRKLKDGKRADNDPDVAPVRRIETRNDDKSGTLTTILKDNHVVDLPARRIRKLTPTECERLQCLPDGYTDGIPMTQRYRCLGNAFNVDVIAHLLRSNAESFLSGKNEGNLTAS
jgi:DNA (cytosine-5)-methyltransferase 3A